jgi:PEP-CTERM motif
VTGFIGESDVCAAPVSVSATAINLSNQMKTTNIIQPLRNHLKPLALALTAGCLLGLSVSTNAVATTITYIDTDTSTGGNWRTTSVAKPLDLDGDNAYGTDGWKRPTYVGGPFQDPSYATISAIYGGYDDNGPGYFLMVDQPLTPAPSVADIDALPRAINSGIYDMLTITMTADKTFRVAILGDMRGGFSIPDYEPVTASAYRIYQTAGGGADSLEQAVGNTASFNGKWLLFEINADAGDEFKIQARSTTGSDTAALAIVAFDSVVPEPSAFALLGTGLLGLLVRRRRA